jgi:hypothetical protein
MKLPRRTAHENNKHKEKAYYLDIDKASFQRANRDRFDRTGSLADDRLVQFLFFASCSGRRHISFKCP